MTRAQQVVLWDAINAVVSASGGNPGNTSVARQRAVVAVERVVAGTEDTIRHGARAACKRLRAKVADLEDRLDFSDNGWNRALEERDAARLELRALEWLLALQPSKHDLEAALWLAPRAAEAIASAAMSHDYTAAARALGWEE